MVTKQSDSTGDITAAFLVMLKRYRIKSHFFFYIVSVVLRLGDAEWDPDFGKLANQN